MSLSLRTTVKSKVDTSLMQDLSWRRVSRSAVGMNLPLIEVTTDASGLFINVHFCDEDNSKSLFIASPNVVVISATLSLIFCFSICSGVKRVSYTPWLDKRSLGMSLLLLLASDSKMMYQGREWRDEDKMMRRIMKEIKASVSRFTWLFSLNRLSFETFF